MRMILFAARKLIVRRTCTDFDFIWSGLWPRRHVIGQADILTSNMSVKTLTTPDQKVLTARQSHRRCIKVPPPPQPCQQLSDKFLPILDKWKGDKYALHNILNYIVLYLTHLDDNVSLLQILFHCLGVSEVWRSLSHACWVGMNGLGKTRDTSLYMLETIPRFVTACIKLRSNSCLNERVVLPCILL